MLFLSKSLGIDLPNGNEVIAKKIEGGYAIEFRRLYEGEELTCSTRHDPAAGYTYTCLSLSKQAIEALAVIAGDDVDWSVTDV